MQITKNLMRQNHTRLKRSQDDIEWLVLHHDAGGRVQRS